DELHAYYEPALMVVGGGVVATVRSLSARLTELGVSRGLPWELDMLGDFGGAIGAAGLARAALIGSRRVG
ncbi:MAG: hypothetical protein ACYTHJ_19380, partial [Planctomycetota bacterium]